MPPCRTMRTLAVTLFSAATLACSAGVAMAAPATKSTRRPPSTSPTSTATTRRARTRAATTTPATTVLSRTTLVVAPPSTFVLGNFPQVAPLHPGAVRLEDLKPSASGPDTTWTVGARLLPRLSGDRALDLSASDSGTAWAEYSLPPSAGRLEATMGFVRDTPVGTYGVVTFAVDGVPAGQTEFRAGQEFEVSVPFFLQPAKVLRITVSVPPGQHVAIIGGQISPIDKDSVITQTGTKIRF